MSSPSHPELLTLPLELIEHIARQITDKGDLSNMRMACKALDQPAAKELFSVVSISPSTEDSWNSINEHAVIRHMPRHAIINTQPNSEHHDPGVAQGPVWKLAKALRTL